MQIERGRFDSGACGWRSLVATAALCGAAAASPGLESLAPTGAAAARVSITDPFEVRWSTANPGTLWARGASYKCSFSSEGATYVPFLGASAPRNHPLAFRLAHVSVGGIEIPFAAEVAAVRSGERICYDRGSLVETYDLEPAAVEQSFLFERLPGAGDLVVRIAVEGDLTPGELHDGLEFRGVGGSVRYGRATVVDADGRRASAPTTLAAGGIEIRVPSEFLAQARLPVVVDPPVTTFQIDAGPADDYGPDVAYDATTQRVITVYEQAFSAADHDVIASVRYEDGNAVAGGYLVIDGSSEDWQGPRVANHRASHEFLVVAQVGASGSREIHGRLVVADSLLQSVPFPISGPEVGEKLHPTVGGDPSPVGPSYFCVAWERVRSVLDHDIHARLVDPNGVPLGAGSILVDNTLGTLDQVPMLSKSDGLPPAATQEWTVVWQRHASAGNEDVYGAQIHRDGGITEPTFPIEISASNALNPRASSIVDTGLSARRYLVAWQRVVSPTDYAISLSLCAGPYQFAAGDLSTLQGDSVPNSKALPALDSDGSQFALAFNVIYDNGDADVHLVNVYSIGNALGLSQTTLWVATTHDSEMRPRLASAHGSGGTGHDYFLAWDRSDGVERDIEGARFTAPVGGPYDAFCYGSVNCPCGNNGASANGCGNSANPAGARLGATGSTSWMEDTFVLNGTGMLPNSTCIYLQGNTSSAAATFGDGRRCVGGTLIRLGTKHNVGGSSSFPAAGDPPISLRGNVPLLGDTRFYQVWYRDPANFCTATTYNITNGIEAVWTP